MSKKNASASASHTMRTDATQRPTRDEATVHPSKAGARKSRSTSPQANASSTPGFPGMPPQDGIRRVYAEFHAGYFAADRIVYIYRPNIHERHVWEVDARGHITAQLEETTSDRVVDGAVIERHDGRDKPTPDGSATAASETSPGDEATYTSLTVPETRAEARAAVTAIELGDPMESTESGAPGASGETHATLVLLDERRRPLTIPGQSTHDGQAERDIMVSSAVEIAHEVEGEVAARLVAILYRIASDPPYWRHPLITVETNLLLDQLGYKRSKDGYHENRNREVVRDTLIGLQRVEIRAQRFDPVSPTGRALYRAPLIYLRGGQYSIEETKDIPLSTLLERGLPTSLTIELGWYAGVRQPDGRLGNNYALQPRSSTFFGQLTAQHGTADALLEFLYLMRSLRMNTSQPLVMTRGVALTRAHIHTRNVTRARQILEAALNRLIERGYIMSFTPIPSRATDTFEVTLSPAPPAAGQRRVGKPTATTDASKVAHHAVAGDKADGQPKTRPPEYGTSRPANGQRTTRRATYRSPTHREMMPSLWDEPHPPQRDEQALDHGEEQLSQSEVDGKQTPVDSATEASAGSVREDREDIDAFIDAETGRMGWYTETLAIRGVARRANDVWRLVRERLEHLKPAPPMLMTLLHSTHVRWCTTQLPSGDLQPWFVLRLPAGLAHLGEISLVSPVQTALDQYWPGVIGVRIEHLLPGEEE